MHWVAWGIDPGAGSLPEETIPATVHQGSTTTGQTKYFGPCPPPGSEPHHYIFTLIATDLEPTALKEGMTRDEVIKALDGKVKQATGLIGIFSKQ